MDGCDAAPAMTNHFNPLCCTINKAYYYDHGNCDDNKDDDNDIDDDIAVKVAAEKLSKKEKDEKLRDSRDSNNDNDKSNRRGVESRDISRRRVAWANDETLGSYMIPPVKKDRLNSMVQSMKMMETKGMMEIMKTNDNNDI